MTLSFENTIVSKACSPEKEVGLCGHRETADLDVSVGYSMDTQEGRSRVATFMRLAVSLKLAVCPATIPNHYARYQREAMLSDA